MYTFFRIVSKVAIVGIGLSALFVLGSLLPVDGNYSFRVVESGSMEPTIPTGSVIALIPKDHYDVGSVVMFEGTRINPQPTTHRIVAIDEGRITTKGDANEDVDYRTITEEEILGEVFLTVPYAGYGADFFATPNGKALLAVLIVVLGIGIFVPWGKLLQKKTYERTDTQNEYND